MSNDSPPSKTDDHAGPNAEQSRNWNEAAGPSWVAENARIGAQLRPLGLPVLARADLAAGLRVLDVGCGAGALTTAAARAVGPTGSALGIDISRPLLDLAREGAAAAGVGNVTFELADAQTAALPEAAFDRLVSRFGVMFFQDPVAAFTNLRRALRPGARLAFVCWRSMEENPWMRVPLAALAQHIPVSRPEPHAPGPMAFADQERTRGLLERAGFAEVALEPLDATLDLGGGIANLDEVVDFMTRIGPSATALRQADPALRGAAVAAMRDSLLPYHGPDGVRMAAACWLVTAVNVARRSAV